MQEQGENLSSTPKPITDPKDLPNPQPDGKPKITFSIVDKWKEIMNSIKEKTGIDGIYVIIFLAICVFFVYLGIMGSLITSLVGTLYPGFSTIKSIQKNTRKKEWLTYWVVFGSFLIFDMFSNIIVKFIPFYFVLKILFLIWMFIPGSNGCKLVYEFLISKIMKPLEEIFDIFFKEYKEAQQEIVDKAKKQGVKIMQDLMNLKKKMQQKKANLEKKENNIEKNDDTNFSASNSVFIPKVHSEKLIPEENKEEKKEEKKEENKVENNEEKSKEEKEKEEHINLNKNIDEFQKSFNNESKEENKENENQGLDLSFNEEDDDKNKN